MKRVLLLLPTTSYRNDDFLAAGKALGVEIMTCADYCRQLAPGWGLKPIMAVHFDKPVESVETVLQQLEIKPDAVLAVDDSGLELAALINGRLDLRGNPPDAVRRLRDKLAFRRMLKQGNFNCPEFHHLPGGADPALPLPQIKFPSVVKARRLSGSRGVIRCENSREYLQAVIRVGAIQNKADRYAAEMGLVVENFIPGKEYALEGLIEQGDLKTLALFDKPNPLDGPYFEETIYVTPSRLSEKTQEEIRNIVNRACRLAGLITGPLHAEMRVNDAGIWLLEIAARSIGGLCSRVLKHALGMSLEELILRQALNLPLTLPQFDEAAAVMMIPIPRRGIYQGVHHLEGALEVPGITGIEIVAEPGQIIAAPPEGAAYLGFIFSRGKNPVEAGTALKLAHKQLGFDIVAEYRVREIASEHIG